MTGDVQIVAGRLWAGGGATALSAVAYALLISAPHARSSFVSITLLVTAIAVVVPLSLGADPAARIVTAAGSGPRPARPGLPAQRADRPRAGGAAAQSDRAGDEPRLDQ